MGPPQKLTAKAVARIRQSFVSGLKRDKPPSTNTLAARHGVSRQMISLILRGEGWPDPSWDPSVYIDRTQIIPRWVKRLRKQRATGASYDAIAKAARISHARAIKIAENRLHIDPSYTPPPITKPEGVRIDFDRLLRLRAALKQSASITYAAFLANVSQASAQRLCREHGLKPQVARARYGHLGENERARIDQLLAKGLTQRAIARLLGCTTMRINYHVNRRVPPAENRRRPLQPKTLRRILKLRRAGQTQQAIADELGIAQSRVSRILSAHG